MSQLSNQKIDVECPTCKQTIKVSVADITRGRIVTCPNGHEVKLHDEGGGMRKADKALGDFEKSLKKLGKRR